MAIEVNFYIFSKKKNSTLRPSGGSRAYQCTLKDGCGVINPVLMLEAFNPSMLNYAHIAMFGRYYYVREWVYDRGLWTASLTVDPLASWKDGISEGTYYCVRSYIPGLLRSVEEQCIADGTYPGTAKVEYKRSANDSPWVNSLNEGTYIVSTMSSDANAVGGMSTYVLTSAQFNSLRNFMFGSPDYLGIDESEMSQSLQKMVYNPGDYILSAVWLPLKNNFATTSATVKFGWWDSGVACFQLPNKGQTSTTIDFDIDKHPQAGNEYRYLNGQPYTKYHLYAPPFGEIELCPNDFLLADKIHCRVDIDLISGVGTLTITAQELEGLVTVATAQCSIDINLGSIVVNTSSLMSGGGMGALVNMGIGALSSLFGGGDAGTILESGYAALSSHTLGAKGGGMSALITQPWILTQAFTYVTPPQPEEFGYPTCKIMGNPLSNGYYKMRNPHVSIAATDAEINQIVSEMEAGFFYE